MTRQRAAAMERAVAAYRRLIRVDIHHSSMEMIADLIAYHEQFVLGAMTEEQIDQLLADAKRRHSTLEEEDRDSEPRQDDMYAPQTTRQRADANARLEAAMEQFAQRASTTWNTSASGVPVITMDEALAQLPTDPTPEEVEGEDGIEF